MKAFIDKEIRPKLQADGGEVNFLSYEEPVLTLALKGECATCNCAPNYLADWIAEEIKRGMGKEVTVEFVVQKPYFCDIDARF